MHIVEWIPRSIAKFDRSYNFSMANLINRNLKLTAESCADGKAQVARPPSNQAKWIASIAAAMRFGPLRFIRLNTKIPNGESRMRLHACPGEKFKPLKRPASMMQSVLRRADCEMTLRRPRCVSFVTYTCMVLLALATPRVGWKSISLACMVWDWIAPQVYMGCDRKIPRSEK